MKSQKAQADSSNKLNPITAYLSSIGRKGGQKSRRTLTKEQARAMVRARTAKRVKKL